MVRKPGGAYIDDLPDAAEGSGYYELSSTKDEYLASHYPASDLLRELLGDAVPSLSERYPAAVRRFWTPVPDGLALDVGAACGRVTFDLARDHRAAWGIDLSHPLIAAAVEVQATGRARYATVGEGDLLDEWEVGVEAAPNASFGVADALFLPFRNGAFATVVGLNLIDRVPDPGRALDEIARVTAPGGTLLIGSPYTWLDTFTPRARRLGGFERDGKRVVGSETVRERLAPGFVLEEEARLPFFIPHHARSGQLGVSHLQRFTRKK